MPHVAIIGAGLSGLACASWLTKLGYRVTILEKQSTVGGRANTVTLTSASGKTYRCDTGATIITMPTLIAEVFDALGENMDNYVPMTQLDINYELHYHTGQRLRLVSETEKMHTEIAAVFSPSDADQYLDYRNWLETMFNAVYPHFFQHSFAMHRMLPHNSSQALPALAKIIKAGGLRSIDNALSRFFTNPLLRRAFSFQALFAGMSPYHARAVYNIITYMDTVLGVHYPAGGVGAITSSLSAILAEKGVDIRLNTAVQRLHHKGNTWVVDLPEEQLHADAVVSTLDDTAFHTLWGEPHRRNIRYSPSAVVAHLAYNPGEKPASLPAHHTISFGQEWKTSFKALTRGTHGGIMPDPSLLLTSSPLSELVSILIPVANLETRQRAWTHEADDFIASQLTVAENRGFHGLSHAEILRIDHPDTWLAQGMSAGSPFSAAHTIRQTGPGRSPIRSSSRPGLFRAGAATIPGVGVPSVLVSGKLAATVVHNYLHRKSS